nr:type II secretion system F family protein [Streptomyces coryli]
MDASTALGTSEEATGNGLDERVGAKLLGPLKPYVQLPESDLKLLGISRAKHLGIKVLWSLYGLFVFPAFVAVLAAIGVRLPFVVPVGGALALAALFWIHPTRRAKAEAQAARLQFRHAIASYLERVDLARAANASPRAALADTAEVGDGWTYERLRIALDQAQLAGITPWEALRRLGEELDIPELARPADTIEVAGESGGTVRASLQAQAKQLRVALLADAKAEANAASESMYIPLIGLVILMVIFVGFPLGVQLFDA